VSTHETGGPGSTDAERDSHALAPLDRGNFAEAVRQFGEQQAPGADQDLGSRVWYAEVALYTGKLDDAVAAVAEIERDLEAHVAEAGELGDLMRRSRLVAAEAALARGDVETAERKASSVADAALVAGDTFGGMRARYDLGRVAGQKNEFALPLERLAAASRLAEESGNEYYQGLIAHKRGEFLEELGEVGAAERRFIEAVDLLARTESSRDRALAQVSYGRLLADSGRFDEAINLLEVAAPHPGAAATVAPLAKSLLGLGRFDHAAARAEELLAIVRSAGDRAGELEALRLLTHAELGRGNVEAAEKTATAAASAAAEVGSASDAVEMRLLAGRVRARAGREDAADELRAVLDEVDRAGDGGRRAEARIFLAEALVEENPIEAFRLLREARALPVVESEPWLKQELERVDEERLRAPVRIADDGSLVIDTTSGWPKLKQARESLERYLLERSLEETRGNAAAAGRLIGETRSQMHYLRRIFERGEGRPSRAKGEDEEGEIKRRSASRPKRLVRRRGN
jgi:tetratricopeptide (TPR) repeat protein